MSDLRKGPGGAAACKVDQACNQAKELWASGEKSELLPCPFCGEIPAFYERGLRSRELWEVECVNPACEAGPVVISRDSTSQVVEKWNTRHKDARWLLAELNRAYDGGDYYKDVLNKARELCKGK